MTFWPVTSTASRSPRAAICAPARRMRKIASFTDPFVLSQATGAERRPLLRHRQRGEGLPPARHGAEARSTRRASRRSTRVAFHDGALYAASSPNGKIYRDRPGRDREGERPSSSIRSRRTSGRSLSRRTAILLVATGVEGKLFRVTPKGEGKVLFDCAGDARPLARAEEGRHASSPAVPARDASTRSGRRLRPRALRFAAERDFGDLRRRQRDRLGGGASSSLPAAAPAKRGQNVDRVLRQPEEGREQHDERRAARPPPEVSLSFETPAESSSRRQRRDLQDQPGRLRRDGPQVRARDGLRHQRRRERLDSPVERSARPHLLDEGRRGLADRRRPGEADRLDLRRRRRDADHDDEQRRRLPHGRARRRRRRSSAPRRRTSSASRGSATTASKGAALGDGHVGHRVPQRQHAHARRHVEPVERGAAGAEGSDRRARRRATSSGS